MDEAMKQILEEMRSIRQDIKALDTRFDKMDLKVDARFDKIDSKIDWAVVELKLFDLEVKVSSR